MSIKAKPIQFVVAAPVALTVPTEDGTGHRVVQQYDEVTLSAEAVEGLKDRKGNFPNWYNSIDDPESSTVVAGTLDSNPELKAALDAKHSAEAEARRIDLLKQRQRPRTIVIRETTDPMTGQAYKVAEEA